MLGKEPVGNFNEEADRDSAFEKYFVKTNRKGYKRNQAEA